MTESIKGILSTYVPVDAMPTFSRVRAEVDAERRARDEAALAADRVSRLDVARKAALATVPPSLAKRVQSGVEDTWAVGFTRSWWDSSKRALVIRGGVGVGKSVAAADCILHAWARGATGFSWHRPNDFVSAVLHGYSDDAPKLGKTLVVIDDVGRETKADFCEALCAFIDDTETRLVITTNLQRDAFRERYDERLIDRLREVGMAADIKGVSRRQGKGEF